MMSIQAMHIAQQYRFFTRPAVRTGLLWKIPLKGALRLTTPHKGWSYKQRTTWSYLLYPSSYKPPYLSSTYSTTHCKKNYLERRQSVETRNKKKEEKRKLNRKNWKNNLLILEMGVWKMSPPPKRQGRGEIIALIPSLP